MANKSYTNPSNRFDGSGPTNTECRACASPVPGEDNNSKFFQTPQSVGAQFRDHGWHNLDRPSGYDGLAPASSLPRQPDGYAGGDADLSGDKYNPAAYAPTGPGGVS